MNRGWTLLVAVVLSLSACQAPASLPPPTTAPPHASTALLPPTEPPFATAGWATDFSRRTVEWEEILSGGPPKDGIPAVDAPIFEGIDQAGTWLSPRDPVIVLSLADDVRAYPLAILIWHEIVNDTVGDRAVAVTFCPLCNASIVFDRTLDGRVLDFGTTGKLRNSDLIMYDRQTESWWQQFTGTAIVGEHVGRQLGILASQVLSFADYQALHPDGVVLARPPASRQYGANPYVGYDSAPGRPFLFTGALDDRLPPTERVAGVQVGDRAIAYPFPLLADRGVLHDRPGGDPIVLFHKPGTASALDESQIAAGKDIGTVGVFVPVVGDRVLTFRPTGDGAFTDGETQSRWTIQGTAVEGELTGAQLTQLPAFDHFWFAWSAFFPGTDLYQETTP